MSIVKKNGGEVTPTHSLAEIDIVGVLGKSWSSTDDFTNFMWPALSTNVCEHGLWV